MPRVGEEGGDLTVIHLLLTDLRITREGDTAMRWPVDVKRLAGASVRVVYDDPRALQPVLRALCASDCEIELLDIDGPQWSLVHYDKAEIRKGLRKLGLPVLDPIALPMSRDAAFWLMGRLTESEQVIA